MITLLRPDHPPQCSLNDFAISETTNRSIWNYGGYLLANRSATQVHQDELLRTVARCMGKFVHVQPLGILLRLTETLLMILTTQHRTAHLPADRISSKHPCAKCFATPSNPGGPWQQLSRFATVAAGSHASIPWAHNFMTFVDKFTVSVEELEEIFARQVDTDGVWPQNAEANIDERAYMRDVIAVPTPP